MPSEKLLKHNFVFGASQKDKFKWSLIIEVTDYETRMYQGHQTGCKQTYSAEEIKK
jgi:hypothetical protein